MDGMTGSGTREFAEKGIRIVLDESSDIFNQMFDAAQEFIDTLRSNWFSKNAVDFGNTYATELFDVINKKKKKIADLCLKIQDAFNIQANANGMTPLNIEFNMTYRFGNTKFSEENSGVVGMDKNQVKNALDIFTRLMTTSAGSGPSFDLGYISRLQKFNNPYFIFYDPAQEQQGALADLIRAITENINSEISKIESEIKSRIETEIDMIDTAAKQTAEELSRSKWNWGN